MSAPKRSADRQEVGESATCQEAADDTGEDADQQHGAGSAGSVGRGDRGPAVRSTTPGSRPKVTAGPG